MILKPAATIGAVAVVVVLGFSAYRAYIGDETSLGEPSTPVHTADDLTQIVLSADEAPQGMGHDATTVGREVLLRPIVDRFGTNAGRAGSLPGFVSGMYSEFSTPSSGVLSWGAIFDTVEHAQGALDLYDDEVRSETGHALNNVEPAELGDEGRHYYDDDVTHVYLWRVGTLVMAAANFGDVDPETLLAIADTMDDRAH